MDRIAPLRCLAEECQPKGCGGEHGWYVPYEAVGTVEVRYRAALTFFVADVESGNHSYVPFVVDTGTPITIIPRTLVEKEAFKGRPSDIFDVTGISGRIVSGRRFVADLILCPRHPECQPLQFSRLKVIVYDPPADERRRSHPALLGLDALRQVVTTFDRRGIHFAWQAGA